MEKRIVICTDQTQADYAREYLMKRGAEVIVERIDGITISEATGNLPNIDIDIVKYTKAGKGLILVTGTWES